MSTQSIHGPPGMTGSNNTVVGTTYETLGRKIQNVHCIINQKDYVVKY
jgi:hypothetical protein